MRRLSARLAAACICGIALSGCSIFPSWLQPASMWKLNQQDPGGRDSMYFSVADPPVPAANSAASLPVAEVGHSRD